MLLRRAPFRSMLRSISEYSTPCSLPIVSCPQYICVYLSTLKALLFGMQDFSDKTLLAVRVGDLRGLRDKSATATRQAKTIAVDAANRIRALQNEFK